MWMEGLEGVLEFANAALAMAIIFFGYRAVSVISLPMYRRSTKFFLVAALLFAALEITAAFKPLFPQPAAVELIREFIETAFVLALGAAVYLLGHSGRFEVNALKRSADTDALTGLRNAGHFRRVGQRRFDDAKKHGLELALLLFDIDDFKAYNDAFGHRAGDVALRHVAQAFSASTRESDLIARYGGEEFVALLGPAGEEAMVIAERVRANIEAQCNPLADTALHRQITVSVGVVSLSPAFSNLEELMEAADREMYRAKTSGKNGVCSGLPALAPLGQGA